MDKIKKLLCGIIGGIILILLRFFEVYEVIDVSGSTWSILNIIFNMLFIIGLVAVILFSLTLIWQAFKSIIERLD